MFKYCYLVEPRQMRTSIKSYLICYFCALQEIGEEFVEFLEKELNITDADNEAENYEGTQRGNATYGTKGSGSTPNEANKGSNIEENIDDIEAALAQLKKELGL